MLSLEVLNFRVLGIKSIVSQLRNGHQILEASDEIAFSDGERTAVAHHDAGERITALAERCGISIEEAADIIAEAQEHQAGDQRDAGGAILKAFRHALYLIERARTPKQQVFQLYCFAVSIGCGDIVGCSTPTQVARKFRLTKANADKFVCLYRDAVPEGMKSLPPAPNQRPENVRAKFAAIRRQQEQKRRK